MARGAAAYRYFPLARRQLYAGEFERDYAMKTAMGLAEFEGEPPACYIACLETGTPSVARNTSPPSVPPSSCATSADATALAASS